MPVKSDGHSSQQKLTRMTSAYIPPVISDSHLSHHGLTRMSSGLVERGVEAQYGGVSANANIIHDSSRPYTPSRGTDTSALMQMPTSLTASAQCSTGQVVPTNWSAACKNTPLHPNGSRFATARSPLQQPMAATSVINNTAARISRVSAIDPTELQHHAASVGHRQYHYIRARVAERRISIWPGSPVGLFVCLPVCVFLPGSVASDVPCRRTPADRRAGRRRTIYFYFQFRI